VTPDKSNRENYKVRGSIRGWKFLGCSYIISRAETV
jgi:hypothetical protein